MDRIVLNVEFTCPYAAPHLTVCRFLMRCLSSARLFVTRVRAYAWIRKRNRKSQLRYSNRRRRDARSQSQTVVVRISRTRYMSLFSGTNKMNRGEGNFVSRKDYASGYSLHVYDYRWIQRKRSFQFDSVKDLSISTTSTTTMLRPPLNFTKT